MIKTILTICSYVIIAFVLFPTIALGQACPPTNCEIEPDFNCVQQKLLDPAFRCCEHICKGSASPVGTPEGLMPLFSFFGQTMAITDGQQIPVLINLVITTVLGLISVYTLIYGVYIAGFVRAQATDEETIAKANKTLTTLLIGFILAWSFIFIIQIVSNFLGLGSLSNLQLVGEGGSNVIIN